jgi:hypothetical protein
MEQSVISFGVTLPMTTFLLWHEDVGLSMIANGDVGGRGGRRWVGRSSGDARRKGVDVFEYVSGVEEFRVDMLWSEEALAYDENLRRDVTVSQQEVRSPGKEQEVGGRRH